MHRGVNLASESEPELRAFAANTWPASECSLNVEVVIGPAAKVIIDVAERDSADVIVLAAHGMSAVEHAVVGSTTEGVLRRSNVSVVVVPDEWTPATPEAADLAGEGPVIVGIEPRIPAIEAAVDAGLLARALRTERILVHVVPAIAVLPRWRTHAEAAVAQRIVEARKELEQISRSLDCGVRTRVFVKRGRVAACIADAARQHPHGIVAVGRSVHPLGYHPSGHTAYRLVAETRLPVLMHVPG